MIIILCILYIIYTLINIHILSNKKFIVLITIIITQNNYYNLLYIAKYVIC